MNIQEINKLSDKIRMQRDMPNMATLLQLIKQHDYEFDKDEVLEITSRVFGRMNGEFFTPNNVAELISVIGQIYNPKTVIDICCGSGNILSYFKNMQTIKGIDINTDSIQLAQYINPNIDFSVANALDYNFDKIKYDLVVSQPPFGLMAANRRNLEIEIIKKGLGLLNDNGVAIFIVLEGLLTNSNRESSEFRQQLLLNFSLDMVISLSTAIFHPHTGVKTSILVVKNRKQKHDIFMPNFEDNAVEIADNFKQHKGDFYLPISKITDRLDRRHYEDLETIEQVLSRHEVVKLENMADIIIGRLDRDSFKTEGSYSVFNRQDKDGKNFVDHIFNDECILKSDDIVMCLISFNYQNKIYFYKDDGKKTIINQPYAIIRPKNNDKYITTYLQTEQGLEFFRKQISRYLVGAVQLHLSHSALRNLDIPIIEFSEPEKLFSKQVSDSFILSDKRERFLRKNSVYLFVSSEHLAKNEYNLAREYVHLAFELADKEDNKHKNVYIQNIKRTENLESEVKQKKKAQKQVEEKNKELNNLIAMFAHNFLGTLQCIRSNAEHDNNAKIHLKTVKMMSGALTAFSIISADDDKLIEQLKQDNTGETNLLQNLANNLALAISQLLSKTNKDKIINLYLNYLRKTNQIEKDTTSEELRENREYRKKWQALQHQWEDEFNALFSENVELSSLQNWLADNFFPVQITGFNDYNICFKEYGITDSIFLVVFMEILVNALKYMDVSQNQPLILTLDKQDQNYHLICENPSSQETYRGTHKGMDFLKSIARKLNAQFITESTEQQFKTTFIIPAELLD